MPHHITPQPPITFEVEDHVLASLKNIISSTNVSFYEKEKLGNLERSLTQLYDIAPKERTRWLAVGSGSLDFEEQPSVKNGLLLYSLIGNGNYGFLLTLSKNNGNVIVRDIYPNSKRRMIEKMLRDRLGR